MAAKKDPTVAELVAEAKSLVPTMEDSQVRVFLKENNVRSMPKLRRLLSEVKDVSQQQDATSNETATVAAHQSNPDEESKMKTARKATKNSKPAARNDRRQVERKGRAARKTSTVNEGPRGFRFGPVWIASVQAGEGVALLPTNVNKLMKHAEAVGVKVREGAAPEQIVKQIAAKL